MLIYVLVNYGNKSMITPPHDSTGLSSQEYENVMEEIAIQTDGKRKRVSYKEEDKFKIVKYAHDNGPSKTVAKCAKTCSKSLK